MIVFLHGVPETAALWDKIRVELELESVALSLPGFGTERPAGFGATKDEYVEWVLGELAGFDEPVDLVGHDWGALLTYRIATAHGEKLRSWVADVGNGMHPDYQWHDVATIWQTPGAGEEYFANVLAMPAEAIAEILEGYGLDERDALLLASWSDETMGGCILDLYRSAMPNNYATWGAALGETPAPGMILHAAQDPFDDVDKARDVAELLGARFETFVDVGHWWALQAPDAASALIRNFILSTR